MSRKRNRQRKGSEMLPEAAIASRGVPRRLRVERDLHERLASAVRQLRDPRANGAIITRIQLTDDLAFARVYVRAPLDAQVAPVVLVRTLEAASGRLRREVGQAMALRKAPELRFVHDSGVEDAERVEALLAEIREHEDVVVDGAANEAPADDGPSDGSS